MGILFVWQIVMIKLCEENVEEKKKDLQIKDT